MAAGLTCSSLLLPAWPVRRENNLVIRHRRSVSLAQHGTSLFASATRFTIKERSMIEHLASDHITRSTYLGKRLQTKPKVAYSVRACTRCRRTVDEVTPCQALIGARRPPMPTPEAFPLPALPGNICAETRTTAAIISAPSRCRNPFQGKRLPSPTVGGCDFPADPNLPADRATLIWTSRLQPDAFELHVSSAPADDRFTMPVRLPGLVGMVGIADEHGVWHGHWRAFDHEHCFCLDACPPEHPLPILLCCRSTVSSN